MLWVTGEFPQLFSKITRTGSSEDNESITMANVLIFGASGSIGASLARTLEQHGHQITRASRNVSKNLDSHIKVDLNDVIDTSTISSEFDYAFLSFNISSVTKNLSMARSMNTFAAKRIIEILAEKRIKVGFFSSASIFDGLTPEVESTHLREPRSGYGVEKIEVETFLMRNKIDCDIYRTGKILGSFPIIDKWISQKKNKESISIYPNKYISPLPSDYLAAEICKGFLSSKQCIHQISGKGDVSYKSIYEMFTELLPSEGTEYRDNFDVLGMETEFESLKLTGMFEGSKPPSSLTTVYNFLGKHLSEHSK